YKLGNLLQVVPEMDMEELTAYSRQKKVGIILWVVWKTLDDQFEAALNQFERWGIKGIKVDFMQRDDQPMINFYHKVCREAARRKMLVDFHGSQKPATMTRTWPNLISTEGVRGMEWSKWSADAEPGHNLTLPFTRMFLGPMDYTPGAMLNATKKTFAPIHEQPMALGTRCHQLAMYVVFESPLQMLADSPTNYLRELEAMEFLAPVPSVWDETRVLDAKIGEYVLLARRNGRDWYVGAMTNWTGRDLDLDLSIMSSARPSRFMLGLNFGLVYVFWGSTYLAIDIAVKHIPPGLMCGTRFTIAGVIMLGYCLVTGKSIRYSPRELLQLAVVGILLLMGGNLTLSYSEMYIPSGLAALLVAIVPLWFLVLDSLLIGH